MQCGERAAAKTEMAMSRKLSVVLVDDSRSMHAQIEGLIAELEDVHLVGTATSGTGGIRLVARTRPDLVLLDIVMPDMDGLATLRLLRVHHPEVRVVMLSSVGGSCSYVREALHFGAVQVIGKPVDRDWLEALLESELELLRTTTGGSDGPA